MGQDGLPSDYGVEMYPGRSIWAWGVLALGAGILVLSGSRWRIDSTILTADPHARSIRLDGSESDRLASERPLTKAGASSSLTEEPLSEGPRLIEDDKRRQRSARSDRHDDGSTLVDTSGPNVTYASPAISVDRLEIGADGLSRSWSARVDAAGDDARRESSQRDRRSVITRADAHSNYFNIETRAPEKYELKRLGERAGGRYDKRDDSRATSEAATPPELRNNDRSEEEIAGQTASRPRSKADDRRRSSLEVAHRSARVSRSRDANTGADINLDSSTFLVLRHIQNSKGHFAPNAAPTTSESVDNRRVIEADGSSRSPGGRASILASSTGKDIAAGGARRFAGMQEDQLLFFRDDRERVRSSAMSRAPAIGDRKDGPGEQDREDLARRRRGGDLDWFMRTSNRSEDLGGRETEESEDTVVKDRGTDSAINKKSESRDARSKKSKDNTNKEPPSGKANVNNEESADDTNAFQILDSIIPLDNKRRKVTRTEDLKDLMVASNFEWSSRDRRIDDKVVIPEHRSPSLSQDAQERRPPRTGRRRNARQYRRTISEVASPAHRPSADRRIGETIGDRRQRYSNYYSPQSATPMAYVHIQPSYPATPPTSRKCVRCMVVYKPCPPRPPPRIVLPSYKYHEPANNWRGLKYGE